MQLFSNITMLAKVLHGSKEGRQKYTVGRQWSSGRLCAVCVTVVVTRMLPPDTSSHRFPLSGFFQLFKIVFVIVYAMK